MGSITYDFLNESFLFSESDIENNFKDYSNNQLESELHRYYDFVLFRTTILETEISKANSELRVFTSIKTQPVDYLKQTALYLDQFVIQDPLFKLSKNETYEAGIIGKFLGHFPLEIDKFRVTEVCKYLKEITPMIAANYIKLYPISSFTNTMWKGEINLPENYYNGILTKEVQDYFWSKVKLYNLKKAENGGFYVDLKHNLEISRGIHVSFDEDNIQNGMFYQLFETIFTPSEKESIVQMRAYIPETMPSEEYFEAWVTQSVNRSAIEVYNLTVKEVELSQKLNSTYLTDDPVRNGLLRINPKSNDPTIESFSLETFLNYEIPYLDNTDMAKLMNLKEQDGEEFANFRMEFQKNIRDLRSIKDPKLFAEKMESVYHEFYVVQKSKIDRKVNQVRRNMGANAIISLASIIPAFATGGLSLLGLIVAAGKGYQDYDKYFEEAKSNPAFLFWKTRK